MEPGIYSNLSNKDYHKSKGISKSGLSELARSPFHYLEAKTQQVKQTPAMLRGSALHCAVLEPHLFDDLFVVSEKFDRRSKAGKLAAAEFEKNAVGKDIIDIEMYEEVWTMRDNIFNHKKASQYLTGGIAEQSIFWRDNTTNVLCKCRPDYRKNNVLIDIKTTVDASPDSFSRSIHNFKYYLQAAFYCEGASKALEIKCDKFVFICVENKPPYAVAIYVIHQNAIEKGRYEFHSLLDLYRECVNNDTWPGYSENIELIDMPGWAYR